MNKIYIIVPVVLILAFGVYHHSFKADYDQKQDVKRIEKEQADAAENARLKALEEEAARQAEEKAAQKRAADEAKKAEARRQQEEEDQKVRDQIVMLSKQLDERNAEKNDLEIKLTELRRSRQKAESDAFALARDVELTRIARRNAELELQRATEMMADRVDAGALVEVPLFPTPTAAPKRADG